MRMCRRCIGVVVGLIGWLPSLACSDDMDSIDPPSVVEQLAPDDRSWDPLTGSAGKLYRADREGEVDAGSEPHAVLEQDGAGTTKLYRADRYGERPSHADPVKILERDGDSIAVYGRDALTLGGDRSRFAEPKAIIEERDHDTAVIYRADRWGDKDPDARPLGIIERDGDELKVYDSDEFGDKPFDAEPRTIIEFEE